MNKKTALLSGILVMLGIIATIGVAASSTQTGMIKKGVKAMKEGRSEYKTKVLSPTEADIQELVFAKKDLEDFSEMLNTATKDKLELLQSIPNLMTNDLSLMLKRHKEATPGIDVNAKYKQAKEQLDGTMKTTIELINKKITELSK